MTLVVLGLLAAALVPVVGVVPGAPAPVATTTVPVRAATAPTFPTPIQHVIVIYMENNGLSTVEKKGPYEMSLARSYAAATHYYAICHPSAPEYLAGTSGQTLQCGSDAYHTYSVNNIANLTQNAGETWKAYEESMSKPCDTSSSGNYAVKHNPLAYYSDVSSTCAANDLPFTDWNVNSSTQANYIWVTPNLLDDAHNTNVTVADGWLKVFMEGGSYTSSSDLHGWPGILNEPWFNNTVVFITYDEGASTGYTVPNYKNAYCSGNLSVCGGNVYFAAVSPYTQGIGNYTADASHFSLLATTEWLLGLPCTGAGQDCNSYFPAMQSLFNFSITPPSDYTVSGAVTSTSGSALSGATVYANGSSSHTSTTTGSQGTFSFSLANGTYDLTAVATGYQSASTNVTVNGGAVSGVSLQLSPVASGAASYRVRGSVLNVTSGAGIAAATVFANNSTGSQTATTSSSGAYSFSLPNGTYELTAVASGYLPGSTNVTVSGAAISHENLSLSPVAVAPPARFWLNGTVLGYPSSLPIAHASIYANSSTVHLSDRRSAGGNYSFDLANGSYEVTATAANYTARSVNVTVNGTSIEGFNIELVPMGVPAYPANGTIRSDSNGAPVANATVFFTSGPVTMRADTNSSGGFAAVLPNGSYNVTVVAGGFVSAVSRVAVSGGSGLDFNFTLIPIGWTGHSSPSGGGFPWAATYLLLAAAGIAGVGLLGWGLGRVIRRRPRAPRPPP